MKKITSVFFLLFVSSLYISCGDIQESNEHLNSMDSNISKMRDELAQTRAELSQMTQAVRETALALQSLQVLAVSLSTSFMTSLSRPITGDDFPSTDEVLNNIQKVEPHEK